MRNREEIAALTATSPVGPVVGSRLAKRRAQNEAIDRRLREAEAEVAAERKALVTKSLRREHWRSEAVEMGKSRSPKKLAAAIRNLEGVTRSGRKKRHASNAEKQRAYRARKRRINLG